MIKLLDQTTVGAIAAGEVVERPLSVVKELVENALDACARRIVVAIARGGLEAIEVFDDGAGIDSAQLPLAFARHATSKLAAAADLERIATLGFRGEGLAAIAAVSRVRAVSRTRADETGWFVDARGLTVSEPEPIAAPPGTRVIVRDLFDEVPARREYLRAPAAEFARISAFIATLSLGYPQVAFTLAHDGRPAFAFAAGASLEQRLAHVFGTAAARALIPIESERAEASAARVRGYVSTPGFDRPDRRMQVLFVNGRLLRSTLFAGTWSAAYSSFALVGRQPYGVLFLDVPPDHVDPNVHPTKSDVRLRYPEAAGDVARRTIASALTRNAAERMRTTLAFSPAPGSEPPRADLVQRPFDELFTSVPSWTQGDASIAPDGAVAPRILAQLDRTYILATDGTSLVLVDQHAAHERVAFEAIGANAGLARADREPLLVPWTLELDAAVAARFERSLEALAAAGLEAEPFGERTFRIVATPAGYGARRFDARAYLDALGDDLPGLGPQERVWASLACHSVVRAGDALETAEMAALVERLMRCENPMHCPHGRPTMVRLEPEAIGRMFKRT